MKRREFIALVGGVTLAWPLAASGGRKPVIGILALNSPDPDTGDVKFFFDALEKLGYGADYRENFQRSAVFVDRILKGAKAGDLPVEFTTKIKLTVNIKTAKALGLTVPQSIMLLADEVIE